MQDRPTMNVDTKESNKAKATKIKKRKKRNKKQKAEEDTSETSRSFRATGKTPFVLLKLRGETRNGPLTPESLPDAISNAIEVMYGIVGGSVLRYEWIHPRNIGTDTSMDTTTDIDTNNDIGMELTDGEAVLRAATPHFRRIWAAITMMSVINNSPVRISVVETCDEKQKTSDKSANSPGDVNMKR